MADSFQNEVPAARVNIKLDLHTGNAKKKVELPLKLLAVGDYSNGKEQRPLSERDKVDINKNNFNSVMAEFSPAVNLTVEDTLNGNGNEQNFALEFQSLKSNLLDNATFRRELENILKDPTLSSELRDELAKIAPQENV